MTRPDFGTASRSLCRRAPLVLLVICAALLGSPRGAHAQTAPTITSVALTSDPLYDSNAIGDAIKATVTFSAAVTVTGTPQFALNVGGGPRTAAYESGSGSTDLVFSYLVVEGDEDTDGVSVEKDEIALNGGTITAGSTATTLTYDAVAADPTQKVDGIRPTFVSAETSVDGTKVLATFSENLRSAILAGMSIDNHSGDPAKVSLTFADNVVTLVLSRPIRHEESIPLGIGASSVRDAAGNGNLMSLNNPITNNVPITANAVPDFGATSTTREVTENSAAGTVVGAAVTATDADDHTLTYTLEGTDAASFQIVSASGQIQTTSGVTYDYETKSSYAVTVKADDANGGTDTIDVTINLTDVNEAPPTIDNVALTSDPGADETYGLGDTIEGAVTFDQVVNVTGTLTLRLSNPSGGRLTDGEATGTIENRDPLPKALLARFGRAAAVHVVEQVQERIEAQREVGIEAQFAGRQLRPGMEREMAVEFLSRLAPSLGANRVGAGVPHPMSVSPVAGSGSLGTPGLGGYSGVSAGEVTSSVTGLYPWLGYKVSDRITLWGVTGYGKGSLMLTSGEGTTLRSGLSMAMTAGGMRGELADSVVGGFGLAFKADAL